MKNLYPQLLLLCFLTACAWAAPKTENTFLCQTKTKEKLTFIFDEKQIWIDKLNFSDQNWIKQKTITPELVALIWAQDQFLVDGVKNKSYKARLFYDYQFDRKTNRLSFVRYTREAPEAIAAKQEKEIKFTCEKQDFFSPLRGQIGYLLSYLEEII